MLANAMAITLCYIVLCYLMLCKYFFTGNNNRFPSFSTRMYYSDWATVCADNWSDDDASVVCAQLGILHPDPKASSVDFGDSLSGLYEIDCYGTELNLNDCIVFKLRPSRCNSGQDAGASCFSGELY